MGLDSVGVGGVQQNVTATTAILDSGTTAILVSQDDAVAIHAVRLPVLPINENHCGNVLPWVLAAPLLLAAAHKRMLQLSHCCWLLAADMRRMKGVPTLRQGIPGVTYSAAGGFYSIDAGCAGVDALPNISFAINGNVYALPPWQWTQSVRNRSQCSPQPCLSYCR